MNKATSIVYAFASAMTLVLLPTEAYAQLDERELGIYTVVDGESVVVPYLFGLKSKPESALVWPVSAPPTSITRVQLQA